MMRGKGRYVGIAVTLIFLVLAFRQVDFGQLAAALSTANYVLVLPALLLWFVGYVVRTVRWRAILAGAPTGTLVALFGVLMIGFATNNLLPARLGEFARAYLLRRQTGLRKTFVLASVFLERVFDGLALVAVILLLSMSIDLPGWGQEVEWIATVLFVGVAVGVTVLLFRHELVARMVELVARPLPARIGTFAVGAFGAFVSGLSSMRRPSVVLATTLLSVVVWAVEWAAYYAVASAFNLGLSPGQLAAACAFMLVVVNLGIMLPAAPGYVGTFQFFAVSALGVWGVPREPALAVAIVAHLIQYILVTAIGLVFFGREHLSLSSVAAASRESGDGDADSDGDGNASPEVAVTGGRS
ncbi:MAG: flippase-like domain-containing protein [Chloroflexi bacterium]|nr:flippase-like domain-containing protein [Chloroflexota bacterium]